MMKFTSEKRILPMKVLEFKILIANAINYSVRLSYCF